MSETEKEKEKPVNHAVVNSGDLESKVLMAQTKRSIPDANIIEIKYEEVPDEEATDEDRKTFFEGLKAKAIVVLYFAASHEEALNNEKGKNQTFFNQLRQAASEFEIQISTPFITVTKDAIERAAREDYNIEPAATSTSKTKSKQAANDEKKKGE